MKSRIQWAICGISLLFLLSSHAQPLLINVLGSKYSTFLTGNIAEGGTVLTNAASSITSTSSISDSLFVNWNPWSYIPPSNFAEGTARSDFFELEIYTDAAFQGWSLAAATNQIRFSPLEDRPQAALRIRGLAEGSAPYYSQGAISLFDLTSNTELWNYGWGYYLSPPRTMPWTDTLLGATALVDFQTDFMASHEYELTMFTMCDANHDDEHVLIQFQVPEPSAPLLLALGAALLVYRRGRF